MRLLLFAVLFPMFLWANNFNKNEIIVKLNHQQNPNNWIESVQRIKGIPTGMAIKSVVAKPFDLYLISFNGEIWEEFELINALKRNDLVVEAQVNHILEHRAVPNDLLYPSQWQYKNTGQSGGTAGADINIESAWDETTGGLTAEGDTIVVCVIDGGFQLNHADLEENMWKNYAEIPNNGIDDDSNGYIDDFRGWSAYNNNDNITPNSGHGTPVAAIVGAKGGDSLGVAGVNWNVKIMGIAGGGNEADALAAYTYPYLARKKYNETNGAEGAFVVATNASWGVNYGQAANAPLWCAFYDSLGTVGILNAGATANLNVNVDVQGDLPTQCGSDYLISVTNMNHFDEKVTGAGYGVNSIDMGAFGQGTYTAENNNGYGGFGGTSGATPHVAGTIALLYSTQCGSFIEMAKLYPENAALLIKNYIYDGLDANTSLSGITTQEGRLNVGNSMSLLLDNCGSCFAVQDVNTVFQDSNNTITWTDTSSLDYRIVLSKDDGLNIWDTINNISSPFVLDSINSCYLYNYKIQNLCSDSSWVSSINYNTIISEENCCNINNINTSNLTDSTVTFTWDAVSGLDSMKYIMKEFGSSTWSDTIVVSSVGSLDFNLENACTTYEFIFFSYCPSINKKTPLEITTTGCGACSPEDLCETYEFYGNGSHIEKVELNSFSNTTMHALGGYGAYMGSGNMTLVRGVNNEIKVKVQSQSIAYRTKLWIDYDQDGTMSSNEGIDGVKSGSTFTFSTSIPSNALSGFTTMRVVHRYTNTALQPCGSQFSYQVGEVEDYCVNIIEPVGINEVSFDGISLYPNPVTDVLNLENTSNKPFEVEVIDVLGKVIHRLSVPSKIQQQLDVSHYNKGIYLLRILNDKNEMMIKKFIKQ